MLRTVVLALTPSPSPKGRGEPEKLSKSLSLGRGLKAFGIYEKGEGNSGFQVRRGLDDQLRIVDALDTLLTKPETLDIKSLKGRSELRLRVGKYRVLLIEDRDVQTYVITAIGSRGDVYSNYRSGALQIGGRTAVSPLL